MFGRGNWAIVGLVKESLEDFRISLADRPRMVAASQMAAAAVTRQLNADAMGINPYLSPRMDEDDPAGVEYQEELARYATTEAEARANEVLSDGILNCEGYGFSPETFQLHPDLPWYGFWAVSNEWKDVGDPASLKEHRSYTMMERPYKFLQAVDKKSVEKDALGINASTRKQVPVLLDFNEGRAYIENTNKKIIQEIFKTLKLLGVEIVPVAWTYPVHNWYSAVLNKLYEGTQFQADFQKRADEATRFKSSEIEKLEDKELESIVAKFFSMTQLPSDLWVGISGPVQIRLHEASPPIGVGPVTSATTLLNVTNDAKLLAGAITFQERVQVQSKSGGELTFRKDLLRIAVNDKINLTDVGAAMLRSFDLPAFRKDLQREMRKTKQVPAIEQFWGGWLHEMTNAVRMIEGTFRELLDLEGSQECGILARAAAAEVVESA